jgi:hypothetical protein
MPVNGSFGYLRTDGLRHTTRALIRGPALLPSPKKRSNMKVTRLIAVGAVTAVASASIGLVAAGSASADALPALSKTARQSIATATVTSVSPPDFITGLVNAVADNVADGVGKATVVGTVAAVTTVAAGFAQQSSLHGVVPGDAQFNAP